MPETALLYVLATLSVICIALLLLLVSRSTGDVRGAIERTLREESRASREEHATAARALREEVAAGLKANADTLVRVLGEHQQMQAKQLETMSRQLVAQTEALTTGLASLTESVTTGVERMRTTLADHLRQLQEGNEKKLEEMRVTVDEKLHGTLERRLGESFAAVSERLEAVQRGLGEMQSLATGVGDLKRVLTNVKARGTWGEYQLHSILEQILTPDQYVPNHRPNPDAADVVEFAIKLPGRELGGAPVYLPIDSKFPQEDYQRLLDAAERADPDALQVATQGLLRAVRASARDICDKYIVPPLTTDFAIMFLPTEGLYAEVLRQPGLVQEIQGSCHVAIAGPTTLAALLNTLRMGFRTLAIEQRSSEVWEVLGAVKTEFGKFGDVLDKVTKQLQTATNTIEETKRRTRAMGRKLREVEELPSELAAGVLSLRAGAVEPLALGAESLAGDEEGGE